MKITTFRLVSASTPAAAFVGMASLLPFHGARATPISPDDARLVCIAENHDFSLKDLRGRYVALHFLPAADAAEQEKHIRSFIQGSRTLAGVHNLFVRCDDEAAMRAMAAKFEARGAQFAFDGGCRLLGEFKLAKGAPHTVVVLDPAGAELFRVSAAAGGEAAVGFDAFRDRLRAAWASPALKEYNLPAESTLAVQGYDVVAYFTDQKAVKGSESIEAEHRGVRYRFATTEHRDAFVASPGRYLPTYGGWCASAMGDGGRKVAIDPTNFKVKDGRLFLFYKSFFADALKDWNKHEREWEPAADANWKKLTGEGSRP